MAIPMSTAIRSF